MEIGKNIERGQRERNGGVLILYNIKCYNIYYTDFYII